MLRPLRALFTPSAYAVFSQAMVARSFVNATPDSPPLTNFILDCEVVALDPVTGAYKTFQELSCASFPLKLSPDTL